MKRSRRRKGTIERTTPQKIVQPLRNISKRKKRGGRGRGLRGQRRLQKPFDRPEGE